MRDRLPWSDVYGYFISDERISLRDCSEKYGLNYDSLRQKASKEGWTWKKTQVFKNGLTMMESRTSEEIAKRNLVQIQYARMLLFKAAAALKAGVLPQNARDIRQWVAVGISIERICLGMNGLNQQAEK